MFTEGCMETQNTPILSMILPIDWLDVLSDLWGAWCQTIWNVMFSSNHFHLKPRSRWIGQGWKNCKVKYEWVCLVAPHDWKRGRDASDNAEYNFADGNDWIGMSHWGCYWFNGLCQIGRILLMPNQAIRVSSFVLRTGICSLSLSLRR